MEIVNHGKHEINQKNTKKREKSEKRPWQKSAKKGLFSYRSCNVTFLRERRGY